MVYISSLLCQKPQIANSGLGLIRLIWHMKINDVNIDVMQAWGNWGGRPGHGLANIFDLHNALSGFYTSYRRGHTPLLYPPCILLSWPGQCNFASPNPVMYYWGKPERAPPSESAVLDPLTVCMYVRICRTSILIVH